MVQETIRDGRETVGDIPDGKGAGLRSPSLVVGWRWDDMMTSDKDVYSC